MGFLMLLVLFDGGGAWSTTSLALTEHGDLPMMYLYGTKLVGANATVTFGEVVKGTGTWDECNRRGVCGTVSGDVRPSRLAASVCTLGFAATDSDLAPLVRCRRSVEWQVHVCASVRLE